jgi:hypothetical protein
MLISVATIEGEIPFEIIALFKSSVVIPDDIPTSKIAGAPPPFVRNFGGYRIQIE